MARMSSLLLVVLAVVTFFSASANVVTYTATFGPCVPSGSCPPGNPPKYNATFSLNGVLSPRLYLFVGDQLKFNLATNVPIHPLTICRNSPFPKFCADANGTDVLNVPITKAGETTVAQFFTAGNYYYGCNYHPGMGATITVFPTTRDSSSSSSDSSSTGIKSILAKAARRTGAKHQ